MALIAVTHLPKGRRPMFTTLSRLTPCALLRRWLTVRENEVAKQIAVRKIREASFADGREYERRLLGVSP